MTRLPKFSIRNWQNRFIFLRNYILTYYGHEPQVSLENDNYKLNWDRTLLIDKAVPFNRPGITLVNAIKKAAAFIGIAIPLTHNLQATTAEKQSKYKDLAFETNQQWQLNKIIVIPLVFCYGLIPNTLNQSLTTLHLQPGLLYQVQKVV